MGSDRLQFILTKYGDAKERPMKCGGDLVALTDDPDKGRAVSALRTSGTEFRSRGILPG